MLRNFLTVDLQGKLLVHIDQKKRASAAAKTLCVDLQGKLLVHIDQKKELPLLRKLFVLTYKVNFSFI